MKEEFINKKLSVLKKGIAEYFNVNEFFVNISKIISLSNKTAYLIEIKFETQERSLKTFNLIVYSFNITQADNDGFIYESCYYNYNNLNTFFEILDRQIKELNQD
jgi:hypothetical protein